jgi:predicted secreted hydrolase
MEFMLEGKTWRLDPVMDDQELDARASTGTLYWEGAVRVTGPNGETGRGYLELTGYAQPLPF